MSKVLLLMLLPRSSGAQLVWMYFFNATAGEIAEELKLLSAIDDVQVSNNWQMIIQVLNSKLPLLVILSEVTCIDKGDRSR